MKNSFIERAFIDSAFVENSIVESAFIKNSGMRSTRITPTPSQHARVFFSAYKVTT